MKTLKLFTADGRALTNLASEDDSILLPNEITVYECEVIAHHADSGDMAFDTLDDLCAEYGLDVAAVVVTLGRQPMNRIPANLISSQRYLDEEIVASKQAEQDYTVQYAAVTVDGEELLVVVDGHHSLEAAKRDGVEPDLEECESEMYRFAERNPEGFLEQHHHGDDYCYCATGRTVW